MDTLAIAIGIAGTIIQIVMYVLVSSGRWTSNDARFYLWNLIGTTGILVSLYAQWNFPSFISQLLWLGVATIGLVRTTRGRRA